MKRYDNLPPRQREAQRRVDRFNADEQLWRSLEKKRRRRRKLNPRLSSAGRKVLNRLEFAEACPPEDAIGIWRGGISGRNPNRRRFGPWSGLEIL